MKLLRSMAVASLIALSSFTFANDIENGPDFGFTPDEYAERFNGHLDQLGLPLELDPTINEEDIGAQAVFSSVFFDTVGITGTAKPESRLVNGFILNGTGNGTAESGQLIMVMFATAIASIDPDSYPDEHIPTVLSLLEDMQSSPDTTASTVIDGVSYNISNSSYTGVMLGISPAE